MKQKMKQKIKQVGSKIKCNLNGTLDLIIEGEWKVIDIHLKPDIDSRKRVVYVWLKDSQKTSSIFGIRLRDLVTDYMTKGE
jgi:hypothetical protein